MLNRWKNKEKATGPGSSNTLPSKGSAKKKRKTGREGGKVLQILSFVIWIYKRIYMIVPVYFFHKNSLLNNFKNVHEMICIFVK